MATILSHFLRLLSEISLFHKLIYDITPGSILIGRDVALCFYDVIGNAPTLGRLRCKLVIKLDKLQFPYVLCPKNVIKRIGNELSFHKLFMKLVVCFISPRHRLGI